MNASGPIYTHCLYIHWQELDAALEPILLQQKFKQGGQDMIRLGDNTVPYNEQFRLLMITKLPNPEYAPEVQASDSPRETSSASSLYLQHPADGWWVK